MPDFFQKPEVHDLSAGMLRQRRNLMATSLLVIFLEYAGASFNSIDVLGIQITFKNPNAVMHFIWIFQAYYFLRYYQYFRQEPKDGLRTEFQLALSKVAKKKIDDIKNRKFPNSYLVGDITYIFRNMRNTSKWKRAIAVAVRTDEGNPDRRAEFEIDIRHFLIHAILAAGRVLINTSFVTDYYLPFILAFSAFFYVVA